MSTHDCHGRHGGDVAERRPASVLDGFFSDDVERVAAAANALLRASGLADADRSWGRVTSSEAFAKKGVCSEAIFGPRRVLACACSAVRGEERAGTKCAKCGVLCGDPSLRDWRFGHVETPLLVHPLLVPHVARALGVATSDVVAVLELEVTLEGGQLLPLASSSSPAHGDVSADTLGAQAIALALEASGCAPALLDAALVRRVPVPPPGDRPFVEELVAAQRTPWLGPVNEAWAELVELAKSVAHLEDRNAPALRTAREARDLQAALALVVERTLRPPPLHEMRAWSSPSRATPALIEVGGPPPRVDLMRPRARALFLDDATLLVQRGTHVVHVDLDGKRIGRFPSPGRALRSVHGTGAAARVVFDGWLEHPYLWPLVVDPLTEAVAPVEDVVGTLAPLAVYDVGARAFLPAWPDDVACIGCDVVGPAHVVRLVDRQSGAVARTPWRAPAVSPSSLPGVPSPAALAWSRDGSAAWLGTDAHGGVVDVETGIPLVEPRVVEGREAGAVESAGETACAVGVVDVVEAVDGHGAQAGGSEWRFVHFDGALSDGTRVLAQLGVFEAVAFSPGCRWIATVRGRDVDVYDGSGHLSRRFALERHTL